MTDITKVPLADVPAGWMVNRGGDRNNPVYDYSHRVSGLCVHGYHGLEGLFWSWPACNISVRDLNRTGSEALAEALDAARAHVEKLAAKLEEV